MLLVEIERIERIAESLGFDDIGVCRAEEVSLAASNRLSVWLESGMNGSMGYMQRNLDKRLDPTQLVEGAKTVLSVLVNYYPGNPTVSTSEPRIARYALSNDYHNVIKGMLYRLLDTLRSEFGPIAGRPFVDSAPVLDRYWAQRAGLGWIGKNSMLISQKLGSFVYIGELIVDLEVEPTQKQTPSRCGSCTRCIDSCPTGAIVEPGVIDSRRCISYLTIESKEPNQGDTYGWCFGCDICQEVCPWNTKAPLVSIPDLKPIGGIVSFPSQSLANITQSEFNALFAGTPLARVGYNLFIDRVRTAII